MENLGQLVILVGAVVLAWVIFILRGKSNRMAAGIGSNATTVVVLGGLLLGGIIERATGNYTVFAMVLLAIVITMIVELVHLF